MKRVFVVLMALAMILAASNAFANAEYDHFYAYIHGGSTSDYVLDLGTISSAGAGFPAVGTVLYNDFSVSALAGKYISILGAVTDDWTSYGDIYSDVVWGQELGATVASGDKVNIISQATAYLGQATGTALSPGTIRLDNGFNATAYGSQILLQSVTLVDGYTANFTLWGADYNEATYNHDAPFEIGQISLVVNADGTTADIVVGPVTSAVPVPAAVWLLGSGLLGLLGVRRRIS